MDKIWCYTAGLKITKTNEEWMIVEESFTSVDFAVKDLLERIEAWGFTIDSSNEIVVKKHLKPVQQTVELTEGQKLEFKNQLKLISK